MASVWIPAPMQSRTGGEAIIEAEGCTVRELIDAIERRHPGFRQVVVEADRLRQGVAIAVDGQVVTQGLYARVNADSEVHFLPAVGGGLQSASRATR
jgi:molybdopterin synthase sulfur carrier subunit